MTSLPAPATSNTTYDDLFMCCIVLHLSPNCCIVAAAGYCDDDIAACFCPSNTTYGRIPAAPEARQGASMGRGVWLGLLVMP